MAIGPAPSSKKAKKYSFIKTSLSLASMAVFVLSVVFFQAFLSAPVMAFSYSVFSSLAAAALVYGFFLLVFIYLCGFPFHVSSSFFLERYFSLSKRTFLSWAADDAKSAVLSLVLSIACIQFFYASLLFFPVYWWLACAVCWVLFTAVMAKLMPVILIPLFYRYLPINDERLKARIKSLAERSGIRLMDVCGIDLSSKTVKANAALVGTGSTRKVILADTLTERFTPEEVGVVTAHEFGHHAHGHITKLIIFSTVSAFTGFFVFSRISGFIARISGSGGLYDLRVLPAVFLLVFFFQLAAMPVSNYLSRRFEREADTFALDVTDDPESFISVMNRLAETNLADRDPSVIKKIFLYSHPPINERIRNALRRIQSKDSAPAARS